MKTRSLAGIAFLVFLATIARSAPPSLGDVLDPAPGQLGTYEGSTSITQTLGSSPATEMALDTTFSYLVLAGATGDEKRVLLVRSVRPQTHGILMPPYSDAGFFWMSKSLDMIPVDDSDPSPHLRALELQLPSAIFPSFGLPEGGEGAQDEEVRMVGLSKTRIPVKVSIAREGSRVTVTRTLVPGKTASMDLDGTPAVVQSWSEVHVFDAARKIFTEHRRELKITGDRSGNDLDLRLKSELKMKDVRALKDAENDLAAQVDKEVGGIFDDFHGKKHPREIYQRIQALSDAASGKLVPGLGDALLSKLSYFRQARDRDLAGGASTGVVGQQAPDFTLEDLDGKKVAFRAATKGKVVLLTFWGYGCGPCRQEAPYLSKLQAKYGEKGFTVIAVNGYDEEKDVVQRFVEFEQLKQPVLLMGRAVGQQKYFVSMFPSNFWIDQKGKVVHKEVGFAPGNFAAMEARVEKMLAAANGAVLESLVK